MTCTVALWDSSFAAIVSGKIDIEAYDPPASRSIYKKGNSALAAGGIPTAYGAVLTVSPTDIYDVIVHTAGTAYAPPVLESFTGHVSSRLDVVLFSVAVATASGSSGSSPNSAATVNTFIINQSWPIEARRAILTAVSTLRYLKQQPGVNVMSQKADLERLLQQLNIDPDLVV